MPKARITSPCGRCRKTILIGQRVIRYGKTDWHVACVADYLRERKAVTFKGAAPRRVD